MNTLKKSLPNVLSGLRLLSAPLIAAFIWQGRGQSALILFMAASLTDFLDGLCARLWQSESQVGLCLDPIADKALLGATCLALWAAGYLPGWLVAGIFLRDGMILWGAYDLYRRGHLAKIRPLFWGKFNTCVQMALLILTLGHMASPQGGLEAVQCFCLILTVGVGLVSWIVYARVYVLLARGHRTS